MKNKLLRIVMWGILSACGLVTFSCVHQIIPNLHEPGEVIEEHNFQLTGVLISPADEKRLKFILKQFNRSLYQIDIFRDGKHVETLGHLEPEYLAKVTAKIVAARANTPGFTGWGDQLGYSVAGPSTRTHPPTIRGTVKSADTSVRSSTTSSGKPPPDVTPAASFGSSTHPTPTPHEELSDDDAELLRRVKPILDKYTLKQSNR
jgi:hypothetical protein